MLVVMVRIPVGSEEEGRRIEERFRHRAGLVDSQPGFAGLELLRGDSEFISVTRWATRGDLDRWMSSEANAEAHGRAPKPMGGGHPHKADRAHTAQDVATAPLRQNGGASVVVYEVVELGATG